MKRRWIMTLATAVVALPMIALGQTFEQPVLVTSAGQSADVTMVGMMCKRLKIEATVTPKATEADLEGAKTLLLVPGFSSKGLGAAGISTEQEMERVRTILAAAQKRGIRVFMMHIGGVPRRGTQSDPFNALAAESASKMIVVKQGDEDGFFSAIAKNKKTPIALVEKIVDSMKPLGDSFTK